MSCAADDAKGTSILDLLETFLAPYAIQSLQLDEKMRNEAALATFRRIGGPKHGSLVELRGGIASVQSRPSSGIREGRVCEAASCRDCRGAYVVATAGQESSAKMCGPIRVPANMDVDALFQGWPSCLSDMGPSQRPPDIHQQNEDADDS
ncbi:hypothetical protein EI94DRAFT_1830500 [Lactarius quietus]|nr:hypothetical protein EI94DRAFT_1830500 [Lactarius quietus]